MGIRRFASGALAAAIAASTLSACATLKQRTLIPIPRDSAHLSWQAAPFSGSVPAGIRYSGIDQNEDYLLFRAQGLQSELVFVEALPAMSATFSLIRYGGRDLRGLTRSWAINRHAGLAWGRARRLRTPLAEFLIQRYRLARTHRQCVALQARWDIPANPQNWAGRLVFGYLCAAPHQPLSRARVTALIGGLRVSDSATSHGQKHLPELRPTPVRAHGGRPAHGNARFPFLFGIYHPTGGATGVGSSIF